MSAASAWLVGLSDVNKVVAAAIGLVATGMVLGAGGVVTMFETPAKQIAADSAFVQHVRQYDVLVGEVLQLERALAADSIRTDRMLCLLTRAKDLPGAEAAQVCGL